MRGFQAIVAVATAACLAGPVAAQVVPRSAPPAGSVIARKSGEEIRFIEVESWQTVDVSQDLVAGDVLRTNATGQLAVLFSDRTQMRLGRNTTLLVKQIGAAADSRFALQAGSIWGRAQRGGAGLTVETAAAAAAIRGTDWSLTVDANGRTSLIVLEGLVELSNEFGSVSVAQGEAAVASIGQAPTKVIIVDPDDRQQMLFYLSLRDVFASLPASPLPGREMRAAGRRIAALPEERRNAEDWVTLAETALEGAEASRAAADRARQFPLTPAQRARLDLLDALHAGGERRYEEAARLFEKAGPRLDPRRRAMAAYGGYFARSLADPDRVEQPPRPAGGGPYGALAGAITVAFLQDLPAALEVLRRAEQQFPDDPMLPATRAQIAFLLDDREQVREAVERALSLDPDDPTALMARANYRGSIESDLDGALDDLERAVEIAPGWSSTWNALGLLLSARGAEREAEAALKRSVALDPHDPVGHANLAILYLEQERLREAKAEIDIAIAADPSFDIALVARGLYHLKTGEMDRAIEDLLAGSTANPAYAQALLLLAAGQYEDGDRDAANQALENADRLDPNDPATANVATAIAIDAYESDRAIEAAQEALKRARARGGDYAALSASRDQGSTLNEAYRLQGLDAWGRYYGDAVFDPFSAGALVDQAVSGSPNPFQNDVNFGRVTGEPLLNNNGFSSFLQGLMLDPLMLSSRARSANIIRRPFIEGAVSGGFIAGAGEGWTGSGEVQGYFNVPFPVSFYGQVNVKNSDEFREGVSPTAITEFNLGEESIYGSGYVTARPTPNDRIVAYFNIQDIQNDLTDVDITPIPPIALFPGVEIERILYDRRVNDKSQGYGLAWSHTLGYRNVMSAGLFAASFKRNSDETGILGLDFGLPVLVPAVQDIDIETDQQAYIGAVNHTYGAGDLTIRYGIEGGSLEQSRRESSRLGLPTVPPTVISETRTEDASLSVGRAYLDAIYEISPTLLVEAGLFGAYLEGGPIDELRAEPRFGLAWTPVDGHWLRAGYLREGGAFSATTLAPIGVVGLQSNQTPLDIGGYSDTFAARWDAEWTGHFFTSVDYQHQELDGISDNFGISIPVPASLDNISIAQGRIDRVSATANLWLTHGFGAFGSIAHHESKNRDPASPGFGGPLPFVPDLTGRFGLTWVHPSNVKLTLAATYVGERTGDAFGTVLDDYWTADAFLTWEPFDKRFALELAGYNLLDETFEVAPNVPGWGRSFMGSLKVRF